MNFNQINEVIKPFQIYYDQKTKHNYYFNTEDGQSVWTLPSSLHNNLNSYYKRLKEEKKTDYLKKNIYKFLPREFIKPFLKKYAQLVLKYKDRPARKQIQTSLANSYAYRDGDQEYNFWFNKFINDKGKLQRQAALTRCDPENDIGYTKGDLFEKQDSYFCIHWAKGCCSMGINCKYYHRMPLLEDCNSIGNSKDIFGRPRFPTHKQAMNGVGCFMNQTKAIYVQDFRLPTTEQATTSMYEVLLRHFHLWGQIQDINILPHKGYAFIKYAHRCQAQYAKQAMQSQSLDGTQIITIKWANQDPNPKFVEIEEKEERRELLKAMQKKEVEKRKETKRKIIKQKRDRVLMGMTKNFEIIKEQKQDHK